MNKCFENVDIYRVKLFEKKGYKIEKNSCW